MKNKKIIFGLCLFLLCSCGGENVNSTTNKDSSNNPLTSEVTPDSSTEIPESTKPEPITDWRADSVSNMEKAIGERLPFAVFTEYYVDESFEMKMEHSFSMFVIQQNMDMRLLIVMCC